MNDETYTVELPLELYFCPACGQELTREGEVEVWADDGQLGPTIAKMASAVQEAIALDMEQAIIAHYQDRHRVRYWVYMRTGWKRILG